MSHVFTRAPSLSLPVAERGRGAVIWDSEGRRYLDACGGAIVVCVGHGVREVVDALADQSARISFAHGTQFTSEALERYADEVAELLPLTGARIYPVSGGSEAVETALKLARAYHLARGEEARHKVLARRGSYHGNTRGALDASGRRALRRPYEPWLGQTVHVPAVYEYRCPLATHDEDCGLAHARILEEEILEQGAETVACFIAEPVVGAALGAVAPPRDYWPAVQDVCRRHGVLLIADEVMTGFGRTGRWFGGDHWGLRPDLLVAAKGASSGYWPFGFAACTNEVYETVAGSGFVHGFTYSHSPAGAAVASAVLRVLASSDLVEASRTKGDRLRAGLRDALDDVAAVGDVRGLGLLVGVELVADRETKRPFSRSRRITERVIARARELGLLLYPSTGGASAGDGDVIMLGPPFVVTEEEMEEAVAKLSRAVKEVASPEI